MTPPTRRAERRIPNSGSGFVKLHERPNHRDAAPVAAQEAHAECEVTSQRAMTQATPSVIHTEHVNELLFASKTDSHTAVDHASVEGRPRASYHHCRAAAPQEWAREIKLEKREARHTQRIEAHHGRALALLHADARRLQPSMPLVLPRLCGARYRRVT